MNVLIEMTALGMSRPAPDAPADVVAAWYEAKARLHERLAAQGGPESAQELAWAAAAHEHARTCCRPANLRAANAANLRTSGRRAAPVD